MLVRPRAFDSSDNYRETPNGTCELNRPITITAFERLLRSASTSVRFIRRMFTLIYLFIYYMVYTHVKSFTIVNNRKCGQATSHCSKARPYRADLSLFLNVPVVAVKSKITVWERLFQTVGEAWQKARLEKFITDALFCRMFSPRDRSCL